MKVVVVSKSGCKQCEQAKALLLEEGIDFEMHSMDDSTKEERQEFLDNCRATSFPQIIVDGTLLGGYTALLMAHRLFGDA